MRRCCRDQGTRRAPAKPRLLAGDRLRRLSRAQGAVREAHEAVGKLVRHAEHHGTDLGGVPLDEMRTFSPLFDEDARRIDVMTSLRSRDVPGGTAPKQVASALRKARKTVDQILDDVNAVK
jgi:argininosuccinate lyase